MESAFVILRMKAHLDQEFTGLYAEQLSFVVQDFGFCHVQIGINVYSFGMIERRLGCTIWLDGKLCA